MVATLWECYADDVEGELDSSQLKSLLDDHITTSKVPDEECRRFIQCMDIDGNDSISKEEFETFVSKDCLWMMSRKNFTESVVICSPPGRVSRKNRGPGNCAGNI